MDSDFKEETSKRESSVASSETSSQSSISSGNDHEVEVVNKPFTVKQKSASLSRLPDRVFPDVDDTACTLPPNLDAVKPCGENVLGQEASSTRSWYKTAECLEQLSDEEILCHDDEQLSHMNHSGGDMDQRAKDLPGDMDKVKQNINVSEFNSPTHTYVRTSALNILAQFPKTETVNAVEGTKKCPSLNVVPEKVQPGETTDCNTDSSISVDQLSGEKTEVHSWSSTNDVKSKPKKKKLFNNNKKVKDISSDRKLLEDNETKISAKKEKKRIRKEKTKSTQSWLHVLRGKSSFADERPKENKNKKHRRPVQKSQSFNSSPLPRSSQLNRMDSFRKLFKRPRDSAAPQQGKPIDNAKLMEISSPILKSDFKSKNLVDREVFLRERAYQIGKGKVEKEKGKNMCNEKEINVKSNDDVTPSRNASDNISHSEANKVVISEESPVAPIRHKHLQRKQRLSVQGRENVLQETLNGQEIKQDNKVSEVNIHEGEDMKCGVDAVSVEKEKPMSSTKDCQQSDQDVNESNDSSIASEASLANSSKFNEGSTLNEEIVIVANFDQTQVANSAVNEESETVIVDDNNEKLGNVTVDRISDAPGALRDSHPSKAEELSTAPPDGTSGLSGNLQSPDEPHNQPETEFEDVFVDCVNDEKISLDRGTFPEDSLAQLPSENKATETGSMPAGRLKYNSDVTSNNSQIAIKTAKANTLEKKAASFSGVKTSPGVRWSNPRESLGDIVTSPNETRSAIQKRSLAAFRVPSFKFEPSEPVSLITDVVPVTFPSFLTDRRSQIVLELFTTERTYVRGLETMIELFKKPMLAARMDEKDVDAVFSNLNDVFALNKDLLFLLWEKVKHWNNEQCIAQIFVDMEERFKIYATYCKNFDRADAVYKQKLKKNKEFERFLKTCYQDPLCQPGLDLPAYLITIVQRIPRYLLLLKDLLKKTPSSHADYNALQTALTRMNKVAEYINSQLQEVHGKKAMQELRSTVIGLKAYEVKGRTLLKEAEVCLMSPKKPYKCLLFNDIMVFAVQGTKDRSEIEMTLELRTLWFEDLKKQDPQTNKCDAIELYTPHRPYTMYACSRADKRVWLQKLRTAVVTLLYGPDCEDPDGMDTSRRKASDTYFDGSVYCGEYVNGKRHGHGVMAWPNRTRYEGSWADDERHGHGQLTYYTGEKYVGNWVADKKEGEGRQTYVNSDVYYGTWKDGKMHGQGVIEFANGDRYVGDMSNNEVEGDGEMTCTSGLVYKGQWKKSKRHGKGHLFLPNGNEYKGEMLNDRICGYGTMIYFNGDEYIGEWVNELRQGSGYFKLVNGTIYDGQWNNDFMNGQGKMTYPNGDEYTGTWFENRRVGKGHLAYAHGDSYDGQWDADMMHGKGFMYYKDGSVYEGEWEKGMRKGHGKTIYKDKRMYEGEYDHNVRHGRGQLIYPNNVLYVGEWKWDKFDGNGVFNDPNTDYSYTGDWCCGMREGSGIEISYRTRYEGTWKADMKHGSGEEKSHAGHVFKGTWKENRKHGEGIRTLRSNVQEIQHWFEGHLLDNGDTVAEGLPPLPRR